MLTNRMKHAINYFFRTSAGHFDAHTIIEKIMRHAGDVYGQNLVLFTAYSDPIRLFHSAIGRYMRLRFNAHYRGHSASVNARRRITLNSQWVSF